MSTIGIAIQLSNPDAEDKRAMLYLIGKENARRTALNNASPPPDPLWTMLPSSTASERKTGCEWILGQFMHPVWASYIKQSIDAADADTNFKDLKPGWVDASPAVQQQVYNLLYPGP